METEMTYFFNTQFLATLGEELNLQKRSYTARFQNPIDNPYKEVSGAVALFDTSLFSTDICVETDSSDHPNQANLFLVVIHGDDMMQLVHELYRRAADEA
jgi:hypothetical protein